MISGIILDAYAEEKKKICLNLRDLTAYHTDEKMELMDCARSRELMAALEELSLLDLAIVDVTLPGGLDGAKNVRKKFAEAEILVVADTSVSPMEYMQPSIRASALLLRPPKKEWKKAVEDYFALFLEKSRKDNQNGLILEDADNGTIRIPFAQICYLEAREKRIFVRTQIEEYGMKGTLEKIAEQLPENFERCHRSFVVNRDHITRVKLSENTLYLRDGLTVPLSRSYREVFKRRSNE